MSTFDLDTFMSTTVEGANETKYTPIPEADYTAFIEDCAPRQVETKNGDATVLDVTYKLVNVEQLQQDMGMEELSVRDSIFLDVEPSGAIAFGKNKNVRLGRLREAVKQNDPKKAWSPMMLKGAGPVLIKVTQKPDTNDPTIVYNRVSKVAAQR